MLAELPDDAAVSEMLAELPEIQQLPVIQELPELEEPNDDETSFLLPHPVDADGDGDGVMDVDGDMDLGAVGFEGEMFGFMDGAGIHDFTGL